jgi:hypothetical protein
MNGTRATTVDSTVTKGSWSEIFRNGLGLYSALVIGGIAMNATPGAQPERLLLQGNYLLDRSSVQLAVRESRYCAHRVAIERDHRRVFGNGLLVLALRAQDLASGIMR